LLLAGRMTIRPSGSSALTMRLECGTNASIRVLNPGCLMHVFKDFEVLTALAVCMTTLAVPIGVAARDDPAKRGMVAVFEIEVDGANLSPSVVRNLTAYLASRMTAVGGYKVVASNRIERALVEKKAESHADACDKTCQIELAQKVSADKVLHAKIWRVGSVCSLTLDLYDLETELMEKSVEVEAPSCAEPMLKKAVADGVLKLGQTSLPPLPPSPEMKSAFPPPPEVKQGGPVSDNNPPPPAVKAEIGSLYVNGEPIGARVDISGPKSFGDYGKVATSLPVAPFEVPAGLYTIKVSQTGYDPEETQVRIFADATDGANVSLVQSNGQVQISGKPEGAKSRLECQKGFAQDFGLPAVSSPWTVTVPRGECRLTVERDGYASYDETFSVTGGGMTRQTVELARDMSGGTSGGVAGAGGVRWVRIPGGTFQMGSNDGNNSEKPVHSVTVSTFEIAATEVTVAQYRKCVDAGVCSAPDTYSGLCNWGKSDRENHPVNCLDWNQATTYAKWVGGRLPTEAEWEYAARSGGRNQKYPWGNQTATCFYTVMAEGGFGCGRDSTWPVCSKTAGNTAQGLCDMAGNVWEWVSDWYGSYGSGSVTNPVGLSSGSIRVRRGGSFYVGPGLVRVAIRFGDVPGFRGDFLGFRPARSVR